MGTITQNLQTLVSDRDAIKQTLTNMGKAAGTSLATYPNLIRDLVTDWLCFTCLSSEGGSIMFTKCSNRSGKLYWTKDKAAWQEYTGVITLSHGESVWMRGSFGLGLSASDTDISQFGLTGKIAASGNIQSLRSYTVPSLTTTDYCYCGLFKDCASLVSAPALPSNYLAEYCYYGMFEGCSGLVTAPALPATTLAPHCYKRMFYGCTALTLAPALPALTLVSQCYGMMFYGCSSLNNIKALFTTSPNRNFTQSWVTGVAASGTFVKNTVATWTTSGAAGVPANWIVETASA